MFAVSAATCQVLSTGSPVNDVSGNVLIAGEDDKMFMTRSLNVMPKTTE